VTALVCLVVAAVVVCVLVERRDRERRRARDRHVARRRLLEELDRIDQAADG
jgi:hypothetical protein